MMHRPQALDLDQRLQMFKARLLPPHWLRKLPPYYAQVRLDDPVAYAKFVLPGSSWIWYVMGYDPSRERFWGYVLGREAEVGSFLLDDLATVSASVNMSREAFLQRHPPSNPLPFLGEASLSCWVYSDLIEPTGTDVQIDPTFSPVPHSVLKQLHENGC